MEVSLYNKKTWREPSHTRIKELYAVCLSSMNHFHKRPHKGMHLNRKPYLEYIWKIIDLFNHFLAVISVLSRVIQPHPLAKNMMSSALDAIKTVIIPFYSTLMYINIYLETNIHTLGLLQTNIASCVLSLVIFYTIWHHTLQPVHRKHQIGP